jgi:hypothetical protein
MSVADPLGLHQGVGHHELRLARDSLEPSRIFRCSIGKRSRRRTEGAFRDGLRGWPLSQGFAEVLPFVSGVTYTWADQRDS